MEPETSKKLFLLIKSSIAIIAIFLAGELLYQFKSLPQNLPQEISVSGEGKAYAKPDIALVSFGVHTRSFKSQDAVNENNKIMDSVVKSIKDLGVEDKDIQTTLYNLTPVYDFTESGRVFKGYSLDQQLRVKIRNFNKINDILDKGTLEGANTVSDLQFTVDDIEKVRAEAREKAIVQARKKATVLANQAGLKIEKLVNISEGFGPGPVPFYGQGFGVTEVKEFVGPQIQTGQLEVSSTITLTYRVR